jgi:hypothetical protein
MNRNILIIGALLVAAGLAGPAQVGDDHPALANWISSPIPARASSSYTGRLLEASASPS